MSASQRTGIAIGPVGVPWKARTAVASVVLLLVGMGFVVYAVVAGGQHQLGADRILPVLFGQGDPIEQVVMNRRLPRAIVALCCGFALGAAGALTQSITRNALASPDILGVTGGASLAAVLVITARGDGALAGWGITAAALVGGALATVLVIALSWRSGASGLRLILSGIAVAAFCGAGTTWLLMLTDLDTAEQAQRWLTGTLGSVRPEDVALILPIAAAGAVAIVVTGRQLSTLRFGDDTASALGVRVGSARLIQLGISVVLASVATAVTGPIGFIGFVAPQLAMRILRTAGPPPIAGGLLGAVIVLAADRLVQSLPVTLPAGAITALIGAPVLLFLVIRTIRRSSA